MSERLEFHPISNLFRLMEGESLEELVADIRHKGLLQPVILFEGKILDGRNRYRACKLAGVQAKFEQFKGTPEEAVDRVWSLNIPRRHLTADDRACAAALRNKLDDEFRAVREAAKQRQRATQLAGKDQSGKPVTKNSVSLQIDPPNQPHPKTIELRAKAASTNKDYIALADKLLEEEPEVFKQVQTGQKRLSQLRRERRSTPRPTKTKASAKALPRLPPNILVRFARLHRGYIEKCLKEPQPISLARIAAITGLKPTNILKNSILGYWSITHWLEIILVTQTKRREKVPPHLLLFHFKADRYVKAVSDNRVPRSADHKALLVALDDLRREIDHERREAKIRRADSKWNPQIINATELKNLIDHIETRLDNLK